MNKTQKQAFVKDLNTQLQGKEVVVIGHYRGLSVAEFESLRGEMRQNNASIQVAKNRLARIAFDGTSFADVSDFLTGPTAIAMSEDPVAAAKVAHKFAKAHEAFQIIGGAMGEKRLEKADVEALAKLPSLDELRGKLVGLLQAPATQIATVVQAPATKVARVVAMKPEAA